MSVEIEAQALSIVKKQPVGVRELSRLMRRRTQAVVKLVDDMSAAGLLDVKPEKTDARGRPRLLVRSTILGDDFLEAYIRLTGKPLRSSRNDLLRAKRDAEYVNRLVARGVDPLQAFMELNQLVRDSGDTG